MGSSGLPQTGVELIAKNLIGFVGDLDKGNQAVKGFTDHADDAGKRTSSMGEVITGALRHIGEIAVDSFLKAGQAVVNFGKQSIDVASGFESNFAEFENAVGHTIDNTGLKFDDFKKLFINLGKELPVSTSQVEQAAIEMAKGGIDPAVIAADGLKRTINFAAAALKGDLVQAATISAKTMQAWTNITDDAKTKTDFLTHAQNLMTQATTAASTTVDQLFLGLSNVGGSARLAGVSFDETVTALAQLTPSFASSADAGTSFKTFLDRLQPSTKPAIAAMESLGLYSEQTGSAFYDAQGKFVGMQQAEEMLKKATEGLTDAQKAQILHTIFGQDAIRAAAVFVRQGQEGYDALSESISKQTTLEDSAANVHATYATALENAKGSVEALQITIGTHLLPVMTDLMNNVIAPAINTVTTFADAVMGNDESFNQLSPTLQSVAHFIDVLVADVQDLIGIFKESGAGTSQFAVQLGTIASDFGLMADPVQRAVSFIQDLVKSFQDGNTATQKFSQVMNDLGGIWQKVLKIGQDELAGYSQIAQSLLPIITKFWQDHGTQIETFLTNAYNHVMSIINMALDIYDTAVSNVLPKIAKWVTDHATGIEAVLTGAWQVISSVIDAALSFIEGILNTALDIMHGDWSKAWEDIKTMSVAITLDLEKAIEGFLNVIAGFFNTNLDEIGKLWQHNWDEIYKYVTNITWDDVGRFIVDGILTGLGNNWENLKSWLYDKAKSLVQGALDAIGAHSPATEFMPVGEFAVEGILKGFQDTWPNLMDAVSSFGTDFANKAQEISKQVQDAIASSFSSSASIDRQVAANLDKLKDVLPEYLDYTKGALKQAQDEAMAFQDPKKGAEYFQMRSKQILEYADLQKKLNDAQSEDDKARIQQQMLLINRAQTDEISAFNQTATASKSAADQVMDTLNAIIMQFSKINLTDEQIHLVDSLATLMDALRGTGPSRSDLYAHPELYSQPSTTPDLSGGGSNTTSTTNTYNMPIYTNNSPAALMQSFALLQSFIG